MGNKTAMAQTLLAIYKPRRWEYCVRLTLPPCENFATFEDLCRYFYRGGNITGADSNKSRLCDEAYCCLDHRGVYYLR